jgi:deoxyribonuclease-1-like protein
MKHKTKFILVGILFIAFYIMLHVNYSEKFELLSQPKSMLDEKITAREFSKDVNEFTIGAWNIQIFGQSKLANETLMETYYDIMLDHDIFVIQEIRDVSGILIATICEHVGSVAYGCINSSRAGRSNTKEQYLIIYNTSKFSVVDSYDYNLQSIDLWERPPLKVTFSRNGVDFTLYTIHTKPTEAPAELRYLESTIMRDLGRKIIIGDLNAACSYYNPRNEKTAVFSNWYWIIRDTDDTTVGSSDCAYDRILVNKEMQGYYTGTYGITIEGITSAQSDHYPIWAKFEI